MKLFMEENMPAVFFIGRRVSFILGRMIYKPEIESRTADVKNKFN